MKKTIQIDYGDSYIGEKVEEKLREMEVIYKNENNFEVKKSGTLIIEFIED